MSKHALAYSGADPLMLSFFKNPDLSLLSQASFLTFSHHCVEMQPPWGTRLRKLNDLLGWKSQKGKERKKLIARQDSNTRPQDLEASVLPLRYNLSPSPVKLNKSLIRVKGLQVYRLITFLTYIGCGVILKCPFMSLSQRPLTSIDVDGDTRRRIVRPPWKGIHQACEAHVTLISLHSRKMEAGCE